MWKDWQELIGPKTYEKKCQTEQTCEDRNKKKKQNKTKKLGFLGNGIMRTQILARKTLKMQKQSRTLEQRF